jgi:hypothetical protein
MQDMRMPIRTQVVYVPPSQITASDVTGYTRTAGGGWASAANGNTLTVMCPAHGNARLLGYLLLLNTTGGSPTDTVQRADTAANPFTLTNLTTTPPGPSGGVSFGSGGNISGYATEAMWCNGFASGVQFSGVTSTTRFQVTHTAGAAGEVFSGAYFAFAG